jgi:hypothetical protein
MPSRPEVTEQAFFGPGSREGVPRSEIDSPLSQFNQVTINSPSFANLIRAPHQTEHPPLVFLLQQNPTTRTQLVEMHARRFLISFKFKNCGAPTWERAPFLQCVWAANAAWIRGMDAAVLHVLDSKDCEQSPFPNSLLHNPVSLIRDTHLI